jgi:hypothetical protein
VLRYGAVIPPFIGRFRDKFAIGLLSDGSDLFQYGMSEGANESTIVGEIKERKYQAWWNADSTGYMENLFFLHLLTKHDATMDIITGSGGHEFTDYAVNGAVRSAFEFVLNAINR